MGNTDGLEGIDKEKFFCFTGVAFDDFMLLDLPNKPYLHKQYPESNAKCMFYLYNDAFLGTMNPLLSDGIGKAYAELTGILEKANGGEFGYLFELATALCRVLTNKAELGKEIETAYKAGDKGKLKRIAEEVIPQIIEDSKALFSAVEKSWREEKKSFGLEIQAQRFGGLIQRLLQVRKKLLGYLDGSIQALPEVAIQRFLPAYYTSEVNEDNFLLYNWNLIATDNKLE